jgi:AraC-like DNA-binding protein/mannose-6-phosphate isomerase-like protein (cupin superfamily)
MGEKLGSMFERLDSRVDVLGQVLEAVDLGGALSARTELRSPWAMHFGDAHKRAAFHVVAKGTCWVTLDVDGVPLAVGPGDVVLLPRSAPHTMGDEPGRPALEFADLAQGVEPGQRVETPTGDGAPTTLLCGSYVFAGDGVNPLLRGLPALLHVPADRTAGTALANAVGLLTAEANRGDAGSAVVVDRLVDLLFVYALRAWLDLQGDAGTPTWFGALHDPVVGPALQSIHTDPAHDWSVAELAGRSGLSRAPFARRFREAVGEAPLTYVTRWRMTVAADLLASGDRIAAVAHQVGYDNEFAFAKAFKRVRGIAPGQHRRAANC